MHFLILTTLAILASTSGSPFEYTEKYIQEYKDGIDIFVKKAENFIGVESTIEKYKDVEAKLDEIDYDFIIVGGGTSGAALAGRLSEVPEYKVLLLEAGDEESKITKIPIMSEVLMHSHHTWGYWAEPEDTWCLGDIKCPVKTPKILGGGSAVNDLIYTRGNARDYDLWSDQGNKGWCNGDAVPYFKKAENSYLEHFDRKFHNQGGPMMVEHPRYLSNLSDYFLDAGKEMGYKVVDYNGKKQMGFAIPQLYTHEGVRRSASEGYLWGAKGHNNLHVRPLSIVIEIIISPHTKEAQGVKYIHGGEVIISKASKEVILSAGAINTPQLLMLSGVGPKEALEKNGIDCLSESKQVGANLRDHLRFAGLNYHLNDTLLHLEHCEHDLDHELVAWLRHGKGRFSTNGIEGLAFLKTSASKDTADYPDVELTFVPKPKTEIHETGFDLIVTLLHPKSSGAVTLKTKDPLCWPKIHLGHLSDEDDHDIHTMLAGVRLAQKLCDTEAFKKLGASLNTQVIKGCEKHEFNSDDYWTCGIRHKAVSAGHFTGTTRMGPHEDKAVVDSHLRVYGVHKLRIADAGVIPVTISGHPQAAAIMVAEQAADLIKHDWK